MTNIGVFVCRNQKIFEKNKGFIELLVYSLKYVNKMMKHCGRSVARIHYLNEENLNFNH